MGRCNVCGQVDGHAAGCPNAGGSPKNEYKMNRAEKRCPICSTMNPAGSQKCRSCNALLDGSVVKENYATEFSRGGAQTFDLRQPTLKEADSEVVSNKTHKCPKCGYEMRAGARVCPACHAALREEETPSRSKTIPGWEMESQTPTFRIGTCDAKGEMSNSKEFTTQDIKLGRNELYEGDNHISREHIHIVNEGGRWYVEDISSTHQTFLALKGKMQIEDGDVLVIGNRFFKFETKKQ